MLFFLGDLARGKISHTIQSWAKNFAKIMHQRKIQLKKVAAWETHGVFKQEEVKTTSKMVQKITEANLHTGDKWKELVQLFDAEQKYPEILSLSVELMKESLRSGCQR